MSKASDELSRHLNRASLYCGQVRDQYPQVWSAVAEAIKRSNEVMHCVHDNKAGISVPNVEVLLGLWGSVRRYQISSILEIFSRNLDEGLGILRMATELIRVAKAVAHDPSCYSAWSLGKRLSMKFDVSDKAEKSVFDTYNFCSEYGTHGHKTSAMFLTDTITGKEPDEGGVALTAAQWMLSFAPMHRVCFQLSTRKDGDSDLLLECDVNLTVIEAKLVERVQNDGFFH